MSLCQRQYCYRPAWKGRKLCEHHTMQSRRHMLAMRSRVKIANARAGAPVLKGDPVKREAWIAMAFGAQLRKFREEFQVSQTDVAKTIGCDRSLIEHYEAGRALPSITMLYRIARAFQCEVGDLLPKVRPAPKL